MPSDNNFVASNAQSNAALRALVARLTDADLARDLGESWTVAAMLAHLALYDFRAAALLDHWQATGVIIGSPIDADILNAASEHLLLAIPPRRAAELVLEAADAADRRVAAIDANFLDRIEAAGRPITLHRSEHRLDHIRQIEDALKK